MNERYICAHCERSFHSTRAMQQHIDAKHRSRETVAAQMEDDSIADQVIDGILDQAMGLPVDDWITPYLPDEDEEFE